MHRVGRKNNTRLLRFIGEFHHVELLITCTISIGFGDCNSPQQHQCVWIYERFWQTVAMQLISRIQAMQAISLNNAQEWDILIPSTRVFVGQENIKLNLIGEEPKFIHWAARILKELTCFYGSQKLILQEIIAY